jgi:signal transduction histidine kinase
MNLLHAFRQHLGAKLFLSYLTVILVGILALAATMEFAVPTAFQGHLQAMRNSMMGHMMGGINAALEQDLFVSFRRVVSQALGAAALIATIVAGVASLLVSRRVVAPVRQMMQASQRIAEGRYDERVAVPGNVATGNLDELGELALRFNQMATKLEQTESMRRQLIADVSHELRTPLTTIKGTMEGLIDGVLPANEETYLQVYREADRLQRLVNDLQELSRVEAGAYELHREAVPVKRLVETVIDRLGRQYEDKGVQLATQVPVELPSVWADEDRIGQVLLNLVGNALQHTPTGGQVEISAAQAGAEVRISVADTGEGIAAEHLPHVFTRFYRIDKSRARTGGGSGIGLTIARHLVEAHAGRIWAESAGTGQGSRFTFTLPVTASQIL